MSSAEVITKRLHVSGLTPQISSDDLKRRFSSFGNVKALDGLGKLDALGQVTPYAYLTLEATKPQVQKCLNLLSGSTWKGAKLRIGEAKPDFRERIRKENESMTDADIRLRKRRRLARGAQGVHAPDLSPVTPTSLRPGWRITPLGRLVRPMRMRPLRPLPTLESSGAQKLAAHKKKRREKKKMLLVRARRRKIDPEEWGSTYLSGIMLENGNGIILPERKARSSERRETLLTLEEEETSEQPIVISDTGQTEPVRSPSLSVSPIIVTPPTAPIVERRLDSPNVLPETDVGVESARSLALLNSIFGNADAEDDWGGAESLSDSDFPMDVESSILVTTTAGVPDDSIEYVPRECPPSIVKPAKNQTSVLDNEPQEDSKEASDRKEELQTKETTERQPEAKVQTTKLKDMFAPRPEEAGFSILNDLELELELDEAYAAPSAPPPPLQTAEYEPSLHIPATTSNISRSSKLIYDPTRPFFFPHSLNPESSLDIKPGDRRDLFSLIPDFFCDETPEESRARWEAQKGELTRDWKRRHREAVKSARRRGGALD